MRNKCTIAVDAMGGDYGVNITVPASMKFLEDNPEVNIILVGHKEAINPLIPSSYPSCDRFSILHAPDVIYMDDSPIVALRHKKMSSMRHAINLVNEGLADACVSSGNTGAMMAISRYVLKLLPKITRPAIVYSIPTNPNPIGHLHMLDLGANVECNPDTLLQFAALGTALSQSIDGIDEPKVGLLNIGAESNKGPRFLQEAAKLFSENKALNYIGFIEGDKLFERPCDVVVCDGFVGNTVLKTIEGSAKFFKKVLTQELESNWWTKLKSIFLRNEFKNISTKLNPGKYNGATILGLRGIVIKSHGNAKNDAFMHALYKAKLEVENKLSQKIMKKVAAVFN